MKKLLFIALSVVLCGSAMAQLKITGRVTDQLGCSLRNAIVQVRKRLLRSGAISLSQKQIINIVP